MKHVSEIINEPTKEISDKPSNMPVDEQTVRQSGDFIHRVFMALKLMSPAWRNNFKSEKELEMTKKLWLSTLIEEKVTTDEKINRALKKAKLNDSPFFPSIGQFIKWSEEEKKEYRVNEEAYKVHVPRIMPHTTEEYKEMGERGLEKLKKLRGK